MRDKPGVSQTQSLQIGNLHLDGRAFLAPMAGITDAPFRAIARSLGAPLVVSEMVASEDLIAGGFEASLRSVNSGVGPHVVQLAGREGYWLAEAAKMAEANGADIIDINMGCPSKRVTTGLCGSALLQDLDHALSLIEAIRAATTLPVTVKTRLGWDHNRIVAPEFAARAEQAGVQMITIHGRTRCQFYKGSADWSAVRAVREVIDIPLVVNGDILSVSDAKKALALSAADAVMIGRGAQGRPWIVGEIASALSGGPQHETQIDNLAELVAAHYEAMLTHYGRDLGIRCARKHLNWYWQANIGEGGDERLRRQLVTGTEPKQVLAAIQSAFGGALPEPYSTRAAA